MYQCKINVIKLIQIYSRSSERFNTLYNIEFFGFWVEMVFILVFFSTRVVGKQKVHTVHAGLMSTQFLNKSDQDLDYEYIFY